MTRRGWLHTMAAGGVALCFGMVGLLAATAPPVRLVHSSPVVAQRLAVGPGRGQTVEGVECQAGEALAYHIHAHLTILVDGVDEPLQPLVGIPHTPTRALCFYWIHTHDSSGLIHIESPTPRLYSLGQFFAIWGRPMDLHDLDGVHQSDSTVAAWVDGQPWSGDPNDILLSRDRQIVLEIGRRVPPPVYVFPPGY